MTLQELAIQQLAARWLIRPPVSYYGSNDLASGHIHASFKTAHFSGFIAVTVHVLVATCPTAKENHIAVRKILLQLEDPLTCLALATGSSQ